MSTDTNPAAQGDLWSPEILAELERRSEAARRDPSILIDGDVVMQEVEELCAELVRVREQKHE